MNVKGVFSHQTDDWSTPKNIYHYFIDKCGFYDPCPLKAEFDGLKEEWQGDVFINPPYSNVEQWVRKAMGYKANHCFEDVVMLLPVRTDTKWFELLTNFGCRIQFFKGRLKFGDAKLGAPFPSMLVILGDDENRFSVIERDCYE